VKFRSSFSI